MENQNIRMLYSTTENVTVTYEQTPIGFSDISTTKPKIRSRFDERFGEVILRPLKRGKYYMQEEQISIQTPAFYRVNSVRNIKKISKNSSLIERIILEKGEIELRVTGRQLKVCSRNKNGVVTYTTSKKLAYDITPEEAINNAEAGIFYKLTKLEMDRRETETNKGLANYLSASGLFPSKSQLLFEKFKKAKDSGELPSETMRKIMDAFDAREREKIYA